jgi:hypothetical protein
MGYGESNPAVTLTAGDIEVGAVEIKNDSDNTRAKVGAGVAANALRSVLANDDPAVVSLAAIKTAVEALRVAKNLDDVVTALATLHTDLATTLAGYVDGLETLIGTSNTNLGTLHADLATTLVGYVDGLETLITSSNTKLDSVHTDLATTIAAFVDGLETLITSSNTKLDTLHTDLATTLAGYVDGLEALTTSSNTKLDTLHSDIATTLAGYVDGLEALETAISGKLPATLGQKAMAASLAVTMASDQTAVSVDVAKKSNLINVPTQYSFARPADTIAYAIGDLIANSTTAGSVTPLSWTGATISGNGGSGEIVGVEIEFGTDTVAHTVRVHFFTFAPTVSGGDNTAITLSNWQRTASNYYLGFIDVALQTSANIAGGGAIGQTVNTALPYKLASGDTIYGLKESQTAYNPANAATYYVTPRFRRYS